MKAYEIARGFADVFGADDPLANGAIYVIEQSGEPFALPAVIFAVTVKAMNDRGSALAYVLTVWVESSADRQAESDPDPALVHAANVEAVRQKLNGTGKNGLLASLNDQGVYGFDFRNWSAVESDPGLEAHHFRTPVSIAGVALAL